MTQPTIWHNSRCSKSRQTLALIQEQGFDPVIVDYVSDVPTKEEIKTVLALLGIKAIDLIRSGDGRFKEAGLSKSDEPETLIDAMVALPILIERPVVLHGGKAALGRPPESVLDIL